MKNPIRPCKKGVDRPAKTARAAADVDELPALIVAVDSVVESAPPAKPGSHRARVLDEKQGRTPEGTYLPSGVRKARRLTEKQRRFVEAYMGEAGGNATQAARLAGYAGNDNTLASMGDANVRKPAIQAAIKERVDADPAVADREVRQRFWTTTMGNVAADMSHRLKASELLGRSQGDFVDRHQIENVQTHEEALAELDADLAEFDSKENDDE